MSWLIYGVGWFILVIWADLAYPMRKDKGYIMRIVFRLTNWFNRSPERGIRWMLWELFTFVAVMYCIYLPINAALLFLSIDLEGGAAWLPLYIKIADDILNGEDNWKKRWQATKNKVKWLWTPAMEPAREAS